MTTTQVMDFVIVNEDISYNGILGRPLLKEMMVITSIYHLYMKFPTPEGIGCLKGCQFESRQCYMNAIRLAEKLNRHLLLMDESSPDSSCRYMETKEGESP